MWKTCTLQMTKAKQYSILFLGKKSRYEEALRQPFEIFVSFRLFAQCALVKCNELRFMKSRPVNEIENSPQLTSIQRVLLLLARCTNSASITFDSDFFNKHQNRNNAYFEVILLDFSHMLQNTCSEFLYNQYGPPLAYRTSFRRAIEEAGEAQYACVKFEPVSSSLCYFISRIYGLLAT